MSKSFDKFCAVWKELADKGAPSINEATLAFFLTKNFGISKTSFTHHKDLSLKFGFISQNKDKEYSVHRKVIESAFNSK